MLFDSLIDKRYGITGMAGIPGILVKIVLKYTSSWNFRNSLNSWNCG
jgi:hypothetical protein